MKYCTEHSVRSHFPKSIMVSFAVSKPGKTFTDFVDSGVKINGEYYQNRLLAMMIPEIRNLAKGEHYVFQQYGARAHIAKDTVAYLNIIVHEYILPENWPSNSPDLNPVDFNICGEIYHLKSMERENLNIWMKHHIS